MYTLIDSKTNSIFHCESQGSAEKLRHEIHRGYIITPELQAYEYILSIICDRSEKGGQQ